MTPTATAHMSYEDALDSPEPVETLRQVVAHDLARNVPRTDVYQALNELRLALRNAERDADEDAVMDVMDFLVGYCSPHRRL